MIALVNSTHSTPSSSPPPRRRGGFGLGLLIGAIAGIIGLIVWNLLPDEDSLPRLTAEDFAAAKQRWQQASLANYDLAITVSGDAHATYRIAVRGQDVTGSLDGQEIPPARRESLRYWTVPGMFDIVQIDLDKCSRQQQGQPQPRSDGQTGDPTGRLVLSAEFDPTYGYLRRYRRIELGTRRSVAWAVTEFQPR